MYIVHNQKWWFIVRSKYMALERIAAKKEDYVEYCIRTQTISTESAFMPWTWV